MPISTGSAASGPVTNALRPTATPTNSRIMSPPRGSRRPTDDRTSSGSKHGPTVLYNLHLMLRRFALREHDHATYRVHWRPDAVGFVAGTCRSAQGCSVRLRTARYQPAGRSEWTAGGRTTAAEGRQPAAAKRVGGSRKVCRHRHSTG